MLKSAIQREGTKGYCSQKATAHWEGLKSQILVNHHILHVILKTSLSTTCMITRGCHLICRFGTVHALAWSFNNTEKNWSLEEPVCSLKCSSRFFFLLNVLSHVPQRRLYFLSIGAIESSATLICPFTCWYSSSASVQFCCSEQPFHVHDFGFSFSFLKPSFSFLTLFRLFFSEGGGGGFRTPPPPFQQNRDNSYTEKAMTFKFSEFSLNLSRNILV